MKACGRLFAICDATPNEMRAAIPASPIKLPAAVQEEVERTLAAGSG